MGAKKISKKDTKKTSKTKSKKVDKKLTEKEQLFCLVYINNFNATQAYLKAFQSTYNTARAEGYKLLAKPCIKKEITLLKKDKTKALSLNKNDILERFMRIAFADMTDFVEWGRVEVPVIGMMGVVMTKDPETGEEVPLTKEVNELRFKESTMIDGALVCQVKQGKDGASIKLEDRQKALEWLADYFEMNPMNKHKKTFDNKKLDLERERHEFTKQQQTQTTTEETESDGFIEALNASAKEVWADENDSEVIEESGI